MYCQNQEMKNETNINYKEWQPLIVNRQILSLIVTEPDENIILNSRQINVRQIMQLEDMQNNLHTMGQLNAQNQQAIPQKPLPSIKLKFLDGEEYLDIYEELIEEEMLTDKIQKSNFSQTDVKVQWGISLRNKRTATFLFPCSEDLGPSWFTGNNFRLKLGEDWEGTGVGLNMLESKTHISEIVNYLITVR